MAQTFYDNSVASYLQTLGGVKNVLEKGVAFSEEGDLDLDDLVRFKMRDDMVPFSFQIISVWHHSMGGIKGMEAGLFEPPPKMSDMTWDRCMDLVAEATTYLEGRDRDEINSISGREMVFRIGGRDVPFITDNFLASFNLPNFYFHATTTYAILRMHGVPLGKMDFLGQLRVGSPA